MKGNRKKYTGKTVETEEIPIKQAENSDSSDVFLYSISALSRKFKLDRETVRNRLDSAGIKAKKTRENEKLYFLDDVEVALSQSELNEAKLRKLDAEAELKELELKKRVGEFGSVAEFTEIVQKVFGRLHKRVAVQLPKRLAARLHNANSSGDLLEILQSEIEKDFSALRADFKDYLEK